MKPRSLILSIALALAACTGAASETTPPTPPETTTTAPPETTTTTQAPALKTAALTYGYAPDTELVYEVSIDQEIRFFADGTATEFTDGEELPIEALLDSTVDSTMSLSIFPGVKPDTYEIEISADFTDVRIAGTVNGEPVDPSQPGLGSRLGEVPPVSAVVTVDSQGNVLSVQDSSGEDLLSGDLGSFAGLGSGGFGRPLGPPFPDDRELTVGDTWTTETTEEGPDGPITIVTNHEVTGTEEIDGITVLVISSASEMEAFEIDFSEMMRALFESFASLGAATEDTTETTLSPELGEMLDQIVFRIAVEPSTAHTVTWFDPAAGLVRRSQQAATVSVLMEFIGPDQATGELTSFTMDMSVDQEATFSLVST